MTYLDLVTRNRNENRLHAALVELTYQCNLDCHFCYNDLELRGSTLATEQYLRFFRDLADIGVLYVTLTGGEPLAHRAFFTLGAALRSLGFVVRVKSNGHALRGNLLQRLIDEVDPFAVEVSLHGARAQSHDRQTRVPGSFERLVSNINLMREAGLRIRINCTLTRWNEDEIESMFDLVDNLGTDLNVDTQVTPRDNGDQAPLSLQASGDSIKRLMEIQTQRAAQIAKPPHKVERPAVVTEKHCGAGSTTIAVDPYGNVYPCVRWRQVAGNLHTQRIAEIWQQSGTLLETRELTREVAETLSRPGTKDAFPDFCPGHARMRTGSALSVYPEARLRQQLRESIRNSRTAQVTE